MKQFIINVIEKNHFKSERLLAILREVQDKYRFISKDAIEIIAEQLNIERTQIVSVIEFYSFFHLQPRGQYDILMSDSITDQMMGKQSLIEYFSQQLNVSIGEVRQDGLVSLDNTSCTGMCDQGPAALVNGYALTRLSKPRIDEIVTLISQQTPLDNWPKDFFQVTDNIHKPELLLNNQISPVEAIKATFSLGPAPTLEQMDISALRGRGGAGFNTAMKWRFCSQEQASERYIICNADEGEPGTFKDRVLLNSYAHQVVEGMFFQVQLEIGEHYLDAVDMILQEIVTLPDRVIT